MIRYEIVNSLGAIKNLANKMSKLQEFAFDTETNSLRVQGKNSDLRIVGISISWGIVNNYYIPLNHRREEDWENQLETQIVVKYLKPIFEKEKLRIIGHNLKFDMHVMARLGIFIKTKDLFDTMVASWLCNENELKGLKDCSKRILGVEQSKMKDVLETVTKEVKKSYGLKGNQKATFDLVLIEVGAPYALDDSYYTWKLYIYFLDELEKESMTENFLVTMMPFLRVMYDMEERGMTVDTEKLEVLIEESAKDVERLKYEIFEIVGVEFNPSSNQQLAEILFGYEKLDKQGNVSDKVNKVLIENSFNFGVVSTTKKGAPQTNNDVLRTLSNKDFKVIKKQEGVEFCKKMLEYKKLEKLKSAFLDGLKEQLYEDGKVHPSFNVGGTDSGRLSCSSPNLQQLPKAEDEDKYQIRSLFIGSIDENTGKRKKIVALDFSNLEMRVLAHWSSDKNLLDMFEQGADTHGSTAVNMFELDCTDKEVKKLYPHLRQASKVINFLLMYGGGAKTLYENLKSDPYSPIDLGSKEYLEQYGVKNGVEVAQIYIDKYFDTYSGVANFIRNQKKFAHRNSYVFTLLKRLRRLPDINSHDFAKSAYCERLSVNSCIQGSAADITICAQNRVGADPNYESNNIQMISQVHDELIFECPEELVEYCIDKTKHYMSYPFGDDVLLNLPLVADADFGDSYQEAK